MVWAPPQTRPWSKSPMCSPKSQSLAGTLAERLGPRRFIQPPVVAGRDGGLEACKALSRILVAKCGARIKAIMQVLS